VDAEASSSGQHDHRSHHGQFAHAGKLGQPRQRAEGSPTCHPARHRSVIARSLDVHLVVVDAADGAAQCRTHELGREMLPPTAGA